MKFLDHSLSTALTALALTVWIAGCTDNSPKPAQPAPPAEHDDHEGGHAPGEEHSDEHDGHDAHEQPGHGGEEHAHGGEALTERDIEMPTSVAAGVERLEALHAAIAKQIDEKELDHVHRTAEEMALVAKGVKKLAANDVPEDKLTEVGRLCNEIAGYYPPIDEAADSGKAAETTQIHEKMGKAIERLKELTQ